MTEHTDTEARTETNSRMKAVDHTHPETDRPFGDRVVYQRGPTVAADGGAREADAEEAGTETETEVDAEETEADDETERTRMRDVDHEAPAEADANRVFERGNEGRDETR